MNCNHSKRVGRSLLFAGVALALSLSASGASAQTIKDYFAVKGPKATIDASAGGDSIGTSAPVFYGPSTGTSLIRGFEGTSDYDTRALGIGLIPPDTMGAVGRTQYVEILNGSFSVYNKASGLLEAARTTDSAFWTAAGGTATGGDPRIAFDAQKDRWVAAGFNASGSGLQIAVSESSDALGAWKSAQFGTFVDPGRFNSIADFPTLALSGGAIIVGTNDFSAATSGGVRNFRGTTLNVLNKDEVFAAGGPSITTLKEYFTPAATMTANDGFALQGVNRIGGGSTATVVGASAIDFNNVTFSITNAGSASAVLTASQLQIGGASFLSPSAARQPTVGANARVLDALDERIGSSVWENDGRIYFTTTVKALGTDHDVVRITVLDKLTNTVLSQTDIGGGASNAYDYYQGSLAINSAGQIVVGYNRSGDISTGIGGRVSIFARSFNTASDGTLISTSDELLIKQSLVDEYHNGSPLGSAAAGRQRWGDYSSVTLDPNDSQSFWVIGEFAREYNTLANHPEGSGSGFARWGTYVGQIGIARLEGTAVPEPGTWALMIMGFGLAGAGLRNQRRRHFAIVKAQYRV